MERPSKEQRLASRPSKGFQDYIAKRIADISTADWNNTPQERRAEFQKAAKRAIAAIGKYNAKRQEKQAASDVKRQERRAKMKAQAGGKAEAGQ